MGDDSRLCEVPLPRDLDMFPRGIHGSPLASAVSRGQLSPGGEIGVGGDRKLVRAA